MHPIILDKFILNVEIVLTFQLHTLCSHKCLKFKTHWKHKMHFPTLKCLMLLLVYQLKSSNFALPSVMFVSNRF